MKPHETTRESTCVLLFWLGEKGIKHEDGEREGVTVGFWEEAA